MSDPPDPLRRDQLCNEAYRAWDDFAFFSRRYFGRVVTPWRTHAAKTIVEALTSDTDVFLVVNIAPGVGKSSLFCHDAAAWATVRDRTLRGLIGSSSAALAAKPVAQLRRSFSREHPQRASVRELKRRSAFDADAALATDFGRFKPRNDRWRDDAFVVAQVDDVEVAVKEYTWTSYGMGSKKLGDRYNLVVWDDLVTRENTASAASNAALKDDFDIEMESRLEAGGLFCLMGQRIGANDLYRYALDKTDVEWLDEGMPAKIYTHVVYPAHNDATCLQVHSGPDLEPYDPGKPDDEQVGNCLLEPRRVTWRKLANFKHNNPDRYEVMYQQRDIDEAKILVPRRWLTGGIGSHGEMLPGCMDDGRALGELPAGMASTPVSVATVDPSATNWWVVTWWLWYPPARVDADDESLGVDVLVDLHRDHMQAPDLLERQSDGQFVGLMEDWQRRSVRMGHKIGTWIVEINAAQRHMLQYRHVHDWIRARNVSVMPHTTARNKSDAERSLWSIRELYHYGNVRLPYAGEETRMALQPMIGELTHYPYSDTDDCLMTHWFLHWNRHHLFVPASAEIQRMARPSWMLRPGDDPRPPRWAA